MTPGDIASNGAGRATRLGLFAAPVFAHPEQTERANILRIVIGGTMAATVTIVTLIILVQPETAVRGLCATAFIAVMSVALLHLNRRERTRLATLLFVGGLIALVTGLAISAGGVRSPGVTMYFVIVLMAGLLLANATEPSWH